MITDRRNTTTRTRSRRASDSESQLIFDRACSNSRNRGTGWGVRDGVRCVVVVLSLLFLLIIYLGLELVETQVKFTLRTWKLPKIKEAKWTGQLVRRQIESRASKATDKDDDSLASIPFYVYDTPEFDVFLEKCDPKYEDRLGFYTTDLYFLKDIENHPWRVLDPDKALLYVVPIPHSSISMNGCPGIEAIHIDKAVEAVRNSTHFKANDGWDHLLVTNQYFNDFNGHIFDSLRDLVGNFIVGHYIYRRKIVPWRCAIQVPLGPSPGALEGQLVKSASEYKSRRPFNFFFQGMTAKNSGYFVRRKALTKLCPDFHPPNILVSSSGYTGVDNFRNCTNEELAVIDAPVDEILRTKSTTGAECCKEKWNGNTFHTRMSKSKFNLHLRGDDSGSARVYDALSQRTVTLVIADRMWDLFTAFRCKVPWEELMFRGSESEFYQNPRVELGRIYDSVTDDALEHRLHMMERHRADLLWHIPGSRVTTNLLSDAARRCMPRELLDKKGVKLEHLTCRYPDTNSVV